MSLLWQYTHLGGNERKCHATQKGFHDKLNEQIIRPRTEKLQMLVLQLGCDGKCDPASHSKAMKLRENKFNVLRR